MPWLPRSEELVAEPVEPRVARLRERGRQRHVLEDARLDVVEREAADRERAAAELRRRRRDDALGERRLGDDRLERRAGRIDALRRLVQEPRIRPLVLVEAREVLRVAARRRPGCTSDSSRARGRRPSSGSSRRQRRRSRRSGRSACASAMPSRTALSAARCRRASIVSCSVGSECSVPRCELPDDAAHRVDAHARAIEAAVQEAVVLRLDAGDADRLARLARARSAAIASIAVLTSPSRPRNVLPKCALRVAARREVRDREARIARPTRSSR